MHERDIKVQPDMNYFEDIPLNLAMTSPTSRSLSSEDIVGYAREWDPMPFHVDEEAARQGPIGKLFASSLHTVAITVRLAHDMMDKESAAIAGLSWQDVRFSQPVFAGDELRVRSTVIEKRLSRSKPDRGVVTTLMELIKSDESVAVSFKIVNLVACNPNQAGDNSSGSE